MLPYFQVLFFRQTNINYPKAAQSLPLNCSYLDFLICLWKTSLRNSLLVPTVESVHVNISVVPTSLSYEVRSRMNRSPCECSVCVCLEHVRVFQQHWPFSMAVLRYSVYTVVSLRLDVSKKVDGILHSSSSSLIGQKWRLGYRSGLSPSVEPFPSLLWQSIGCNKNNHMTSFFSPPHSVCPYLGENQKNIYVYQRQTL